MKHYPKPTDYDIHTGLFDANNQIGVAVTLTAQMPNGDIRIFRHAERVKRENAAALVSPSDMSMAVLTCMVRVNDMYRMACKTPDNQPSEWKQQAEQTIKEQYEKENP